MTPRVLLAILLTASLHAQSQGGGTTGGGGGTTGGGNTGGGSTTPGGSTGGGQTSPGRFPTGQQQQQSPTRIPQPIFVSGTVVLSDGSKPNTQIVIERVCSTRTVREGYVDSKGRFAFQLGANVGVFADASTSDFGGGGFGNNNLGGGNFGSNAAGGFGGSNQGVTQESLFGCELRASLPGYRSDTIPLANRRPMDMSDVGTIILHSMANVKGLTTSATTALAPKDAKKAFEKGSKALEKNNPDEAQSELLKAVELHPRFAEAWYRLGLVYERREHKDEAREAYAKAIAADGNLTPPYERLYLMAFNEAKWPEVAEQTDRVLRLNPYDNPGAYYFNAVANYQLKKLDEAEKSAREAVKITGRMANPRSFYVLGLVLAMKGDFAGSKDSLTAFMKVAPPDVDRSKIEKLMSDVDRAAAESKDQAAAGQ